MSASSATTAVVPCFATVTLVLADEVMSAELSSLSTAFVSPLEPKTMRVPITPQTTIRELAKGAMARFMYSMRRTAGSANLVARQLCRTGIVATDVHLLSPDNFLPSAHEPPETPLTPSLHSERHHETARSSVCKIELFSEDFVMQVVRVREEVVYMRLQGAKGHAKKRKEEGATDAVTVPPPSNTKAAPAPEADTSAPSMKAAGPDASHTANWSLMAAEHSVTTGLTTDEDVVCCNAEESSKGDISMSVPMLLGETSAGTITAPTSSKPAVHPTRARARNQRSLSSSDSTEEPSESSGSSDSDSQDEEEEEAYASIARSIATLRETETRRMRWGPDAHKHFATNYVNSPQKIMKRKYIGKPQQPPPSLKLHHSQASLKPSATSASTAKKASKQLPQQPPRQSGELSFEDDAVHPAPYKMRRLDDASSCDHSQVSVALSCHTSSPSVTPNARGGSHTRSCLFPPTDAPATIASKDLNSAEVPASAGDADLQLTGVDSVEKDGSFEQGPVIATTPIEAVLARMISPADPSTVAKPVQGVVARQLSFEDPGSSGTLDSATPVDCCAADDHVPPVRVVRVEHMEPCA